ncbi:MAG: hypothetical protein A3J79_03515, partial [Elusimicrobia bacterium RIFOXYB2_FULL_62_6]
CGGGNLNLSVYDPSLVLQSSSSFNSTGASSTDQGWGAAVGPDGSVYAAGIVNQNCGGQNAWVGKYNSSLVLQSSASFDGPVYSYDGAQAVAADASGNIYTAGYVNEYRPNNVLNNNMLVAKYNASLVLLATASFSAQPDGDERAWAVAPGQGGAVYAAGIAAGHLWLWKYDSSLVLQATATVTGTANNSDIAYGIAVASNGTVYAAGMVENSGTGNDLWVGRYDPALVLESSATFNGPLAASDDYGSRVAVNGDGDVFVAGEVESSAENWNIWLGKYDAYLALVSSTVYGASALVDEMYSITADEKGRVFLSGTSPEGDGDIWAAQFNTALVFQSSFTVDGPGVTVDRGAGIATDGNGAVYAVGTLSLAANSEEDIYLSKYQALATPPAVGIADPPDNSYKYALDAVAGTAFDDVSVSSAQLSIQRLSDGLYWNGSAWAAGPLWLDAGVDANNWTYESVPSWVSRSSYTVVAKARDRAGDWSQLYSTSTFTFGEAPAGCGVNATREVAKSGYQYSSIQAAVNSISAVLSTTACVVIRDAETYSEQVTVRNFANNGYRLKIMADPTFVSSAPLVNPPAFSTAAFQVFNDSVSVLGINIISTNSVQYGIRASSSAVTVSSVNIVSGGKIYTAGISISSYSEVSFSSITVQSAVGLRLNGSGTTVSFSTVTSTLVNSYGAALYLNGVSSNTITQSYIANLGTGGCAAGYVGAGAHLTGGASNNTISLSTITSSVFGYCGGAVQLTD